ncbi:YesL family protein [Metabacillus sp. FJAT-53654]|uniref:DUF624 domain-containing protein n=1 Tax=Metabacillus rhizosphaerae TaxID=3117747 RepID=A0ABZ2MRV3_9BACI
MTDLMSGLNRILEWVMRLSVINLLWIGFNLPICYLVLSLLYANDSSALFMLLATIIILAPFFFFPATTAMFGVARKWVMGDHDVPLVKSYWKYYKENYVRSLCGGIIFTLIWIIWGVDFYFFSKVNIIISSLFLVGFFFLFLITLFFFANTVHADLKLFTSIKNSFFLSLVYPLTNLVIVVITGIIIYVSLTMFTFLIPFFMGTLIAFIAFAGYYQKVVKIHGDNREVTE